MGVATLGFQDGPSILFRIDPNDVHWNFKINTTVQETVGGRVVQVLGATLSDITVLGSFGEKKGTPRSPTHEVSWELAEAFVARVRDLITFQSRDSSVHAKMHPAAVFNYPPKGWRFAVYVKGISDGRGAQAVSHTPGHFAYDYALTLFIVTDLSQSVVKVGGNNGVIQVKRAQAIEDYMLRLTDGIGWKQTEFNGPGVNNPGVTGDKSTVPAGSHPFNGNAPPPSAGRRGTP